QRSQQPSPLCMPRGDKPDAPIDQTPPSTANGAVPGMAMAENRPQVDCRLCGACCIAEIGRPEGAAQSSGWADCTVVDVVRLSRRTRAKLVPVTRRMSCRIYTNRPEICRRFEPGSEDCQSARGRIGLS